MERIAVQSRDIAIVGYDPETLMLEITFRGGGVYQYKDVTEAVYQNLLRAESLGTYFNQNIKNSYEYVKVT